MCIDMANFKYSKSMVKYINVVFHVLSKNYQLLEAGRQLG